MLNNWRMAQLHAQEAPERVLELEEWGALFDRTPDGLISQRDFGGHKYARLAHVGDRTGLEMIRTLQQRAVALGIDVFMECTVTEIFTEDARRGREPASDHAARFAYWRETGRFVVFRTPSVVLATGGIGKSYQVTSNSWEYTGDGHALALRAGASLINMEFVQFHPTGMVWPPVGAGHPRHRVGPGRRRRPEELRGRALHVRLHPGVLPGRDRRHRSRRPRAGTPTRRTTGARPSCCRATRWRGRSTPRSRPGRGSPHGGVFLDIASRRDADFIRRRLPVDVPPVQGARRRRHHRRADGGRAHLPLRDGRGRGRRRHRGVASSRGCTPRVRSPAACTGRTGSAATRSPTCWCSAAAPAQRRLPRLPDGARTRPGSTRRTCAPPRTGRWRRSSPPEPGGGENPYTIQKDLQDVMQRLVGIIRRADELRGVARRDRAAQGARQAPHRRGAPAVQPRLAPRPRPHEHARGLGVHRQGGARAARSPAAATPATTSRSPTPSGAR